MASLDFNEIVVPKKTSFDISKLSGRVFVYGAGAFGRDVASSLVNRGINIVAFLDAFAQHSPISNIPLVSLANVEIGNQDCVIVAVFNRNAPLSEIYNSLILKGVKPDRVFMPWEYFSTLKAEMGWRFWLDSSDYYAYKFEQVRTIYELFSDDLSRYAFLKILKFRAGNASNHCCDLDDERQYFNSLTLPKLAAKNTCTYIDLGAYDGSSYLALKKLCPNLNVLPYLFEPDPYNFRMMIEKLDGTGCNIPLAVSNENGILIFNAGNGESSSINGVGAEPVFITSVRLDDFFSNSIMIDFIKMDIEGQELNALKGVHQLIMRCRPILAISIYHKPEDIVEIPGYIHKNYDFYRFYLRRHAYNSFDSVLYCIPS